MRVTGSHETFLFLARIVFEFARTLFSRFRAAHSQHFVAGNECVDFMVSHEFHERHIAAEQQPGLLLQLAKLFAIATLEHRNVLRGRRADE